jgi:hypothetical protein
MSTIIDDILFVLELYALIVGRENINFKTQRAVHIVIALVIEDMSCDLGLHRDKYKTMDSYAFCEEYARSYEKYINLVAEKVLADGLDYWDQKTKSYLMNLTHRKLGKNFNKLIYRRIYKSRYEG